MYRLPLGSTPYDTLYPYTTRVRSVIPADRSGSWIASRMLPSPRTARYSGSDRPAWRMNHTGTREAGRPRAARSRGASARSEEGAIDLTLGRARVNVEVAGERETPRGARSKGRPNR